MGQCRLEWRRCTRRSVGHSLRNPWRYRFDRHTGDLWIADVGQNVYEEINCDIEGHAGGMDSGWPIMEALHCFEASDWFQTGLQLPIFEYDHAQGCSVHRRLLLSRQQIPHAARRLHLWRLCAGTIWATIPDPDGSWNTTKMLTADARISSFGEDEGPGELYVTDLSSGTIYRVTGQ